MKITVKAKEITNESLKIKDLKPGTVFKYFDGAIGLRGCASDVVFLLGYTLDTNWLEIADGYLTFPIEKVLGQIEEIIVNPNL